MFSLFFINRPIFAMVISIFIVIVGVISIPTLPVESMPDITPPTVKVTTNFPGANAQVVEQTITTPIEQQVNGVEDMIYMQSKSTASGALDLTVTFEIGTDVDMASILTKNRVAVAEPLLPEDVKRQGVQVKKQSTNLTLMVNIISPDGSFDDIFISNYSTTRIKDVLARIPGVGEVQSMGAKDFGMRIWLQPDQMKARGLTTEDVLQSLREQNVQVAAGKIGAQPNPAGLNFEYTVTTQGRLETEQQFREIVLKTGEGGRLVRLGDVARIELGAQDYSWYVELDGAPSVALAIYQLPGANALAVAQGIREAMDVLSEDFPSGLDYRIVFDSTEYVEASISEVVETLIVAIILVVLTVFIFLQDVRTTLIPAITIPVSLIGTFAIMKVAGLSINNLTLFGLVLAIGIVVDDAITVVENTMRHLDSGGKTAKEATALAMKEVSGAVIATTLVLLAVFVPSAMMPGLTGRMYQQFAITISISTIISSINALTLSPALCGVLLRPSKTQHGWFFSKFNQMFEVGTGQYMGVVRFALRRVGLVAALFAILLVGTYFTMTTLPSGFLPDEDQGYFFVNVELPNGASAERTREVLDQVSSWVAELPGLRGYITIGGYSFLNAVQGSNYGAVVVTLVPWSERDVTVADNIAALQKPLWMLQEARAFAFGPPPINGLGNASGFTMELQDQAGLGLANLEQFADDLVAAAAQSPVIARPNQNFSAAVPQLYLDVDRERAKTYDIPLESVFSTLQANLGSAYVNDFNLFGRTWKVMMQADTDYRAVPSDIGNLEVRSRSGAMVPVGAIASVRDTTGPQVINRFNMFPSATISGVPTPGHSSGEATDAMEQFAAQLLPAGMGYAWSGVTFQEKAAGNMAPIIFGLALIFVFLFLSAQYESWSIPMAVMLVVPVSLFGACLLTGLRGMDNNIYTQIGLVLLLGLSAKAAILIVEFAKQLREEGKSTREAALTSAELRFRPILMTTLSFLLGVIPLLVATGAGSGSRRALGTAVFGGMLFATVLGVFVIPYLYFVIQTAAEKFGSRKSPVPNPDPAEAS